MWELQLRGFYAYKHTNFALDAYSLYNQIQNMLPTKLSSSTLPLFDTEHNIVKHSIIRNILVTESFTYSWKVVFLLLCATLISSLWFTENLIVKIRIILHSCLRTFHTIVSSCHSKKTFSTCPARLYANYIYTILLLILITC